MREPNCIVCDNDAEFDIYLAGTHRHSNFLKCKRCGFVFAFPRVPVNYAEMPEHFKWKSDVALRTRLANYDIRYDLMKKHIDVPAPTFLDIGAHTGIFQKLLKDKGVEGTGIELSKAAAEYGRQHFGVDILSEGLEYLEGKRQFDAITLFNVFEHFDDPVSSLNQIRNLCRPGGIIALELPYIFTIQARLFGGRWHHFRAKGHFWFYNEKTITKLLERYGFSVLESSFVPKVVTLATLAFYGLGVMPIGRLRKRYLNLRFTSPLTNIA